MAAESALAEAAAVPGLAAEVSRRGGHVPVLRLPCPARPSAARSRVHDTVRLPLRDGRGG